MNYSKPSLRDYLIWMIQIVILVIGVFVVALIALVVFGIGSPEQVIEATLEMLNV